MLDRQFCLTDSRLGDFLRPALWRTAGARQLFFTSLLTDQLGTGPTLTVTNRVPDMHHFCGRGGKDVIPLWRDVEATRPNMPVGLLDALEKALGVQMTPEELFAYCYALLSAPGYVDRFADELEIPGPHVPVTLNSELFLRGVSLGERLIWLHTFGERFIPEGFRAGQVPQGIARATESVGTEPEDYPARHSYDAETQELHVGAGVFAPVAPEVRASSVSGLD